MVLGSLNPKPQALNPTLQALKWIPQLDVFSSLRKQPDARTGNPYSGNEAVLVLGSRFVSLRFFRNQGVRVLGDRVEDG